MCVDKRIVAKVPKRFFHSFEYIEWVHKYINTELTWYCYWIKYIPVFVEEKITSDSRSLDVFSVEKKRTTPPDNPPLKRNWYRKKRNMHKIAIKWWASYWEKGFQPLEKKWGFYNIPMKHLSMSFKYQKKLGLQTVWLM